MAKCNFNFGKLNEYGDIEYALLPLIIGEENVWTNVPEKYIECGYYPIVTTETPEKEGFYYAPYFELENNELVQKWEEHELPTPVEIIKADQIQKAIEEGVNSI